MGLWMTADAVPPHRRDGASSGAAAGVSDAAARVGDGGVVMDGDIDVRLCMSGVHRCAVRAAAPWRRLLESVDAGRSCARVMMEGALGGVGGVAGR